VILDKEMMVLSRRRVVIPDQKQLWDDLHAHNDLRKYSREPTSFALVAAPHFPKETLVLELGCGEGNDAVFFAKQGCSVLATDFSETVILHNNQRYNGDFNIAFGVVDITESFPFGDNSFGVVYARQSLQFFDDITTKEIFKEIHRVLGTRGLLCFSCRSTNDPLLYGKGEEVGKHMFLEERDDGNGLHLRHFFSEEYALECLGDRFGVVLLQDIIREVYGDLSGTIEVVAQKL